MTRRVPSEAGSMLLRQMSSDSGEPNSSRGLKVAGLFAGIGGIEMGLRRADHSTVLLCENDAAANAVLDERFPGVPRHDDVRTLDGLLSRGPADGRALHAKTCRRRGERPASAANAPDSSSTSSNSSIMRSTSPPGCSLRTSPSCCNSTAAARWTICRGSLDVGADTWAYRTVDTRAFWPSTAEAARLFWLHAKRTHALPCSQKTQVLRSASSRTPTPAASIGPRVCGGLGGPSTPSRRSRADPRSAFLPLPRFGSAQPEKSGHPASTTPSGCRGSTAIGQPRRNLTPGETGRDGNSLGTPSACRSRTGSASACAAQMLGTEE